MSRPETQWLLHFSKLLQRRKSDVERYDRNLDVSHPGVSEIADLLLFRKPTERVGPLPRAVEIRQVISPIDAAEKLRMTYRISELESKIARLEDRIDLLESRKSVELRTATQDPALIDVLRVTAKLFPGSAPTFEIDCDPLDSSVQFVVINVTVDADVDEIVSNQIAWHQQIDNLPRTSSGQLRLNICFKA